MTKDDEQILVVPADIIFKQGRWQGLKRDNLDYYLDLIKNNCQFLRRGDVEEDPSFQQIIPYIIFSYTKPQLNALPSAKFNGTSKFFIYKYLPKAGEQRLVNTYQIGVGGHINKIDSDCLYHNFNGRENNGTDVLEVGMMREWNEEVDYRGNLLEKKLIGLLNDDSRPVEQVHLGLVYSFVGDSSEISIKEKDKMQGQLVDLKDIGDKIKNNDGVWVKIVYRDYLKQLI